MVVLPYIYIEQMSYQLASSPLSYKTKQEFKAVSGEMERKGEFQEIFIR